MSTVRSQDRALDATVDDEELLPEELKRRRKIQHEAAEAAYIERYKLRLKRGILVGAIGSAFISAFVPGSWFWPIFMALVGGACGFYVVRNEAGHLIGISLFGVTAALVSLTHVNFAGIKDVGTGFIIVTTWLFHMILGWLVTTLSQEQRSREESF